MENLTTIKKGFSKVNLEGQKLTVKQVNYGYKNGGIDKIFSALVDIDSIEYWFNDAQFFNFINN